MEADPLAELLKVRSASRRSAFTATPKLTSSRKKTGGFMDRRVIAGLPRPDARRARPSRPTLSEWAALRFGLHRADLRADRSEPSPWLDRSELPKPSDKAPRRLFTKAELAATLRAAVGQNRLIFAVAGTVGSRISETLGLDEDNLDLADLDEASITFTHQVDRMGNRLPLKTEAAERTVEIPRQLAAMLVDHLLATAHRRGRNGQPRYVFCTESGRPLNQRNV